MFLGSNFVKPPNLLKNPEEKIQSYFILSIFCESNLNFCSQGEKSIPESSTYLTFLRSLLSTLASSCPPFLHLQLIAVDCREVQSTFWISGFLDFLKSQNYRRIKWIYLLYSSFFGLSFYTSLFSRCRLLADWFFSEESISLFFNIHVFLLLKFIL